jgi:hypothetical protein
MSRSRSTKPSEKDEIIRDVTMLMPKAIELLEKIQERESKPYKTAFHAPKNLAERNESKLIQCLRQYKEATHELSAAFKLLKTGSKRAEDLKDFLKALFTVFSELQTWTSESYPKLYKNDGKESACAKLFTRITKVLKRDDFKDVSEDVLNLYARVRKYLEKQRESAEVKEVIEFILALDYLERGLPNPPMTSPTLGRNTTRTRGTMGGGRGRKRRTIRRSRV